MKALERFAGMGVLVVDDNPSNVALLTALLRAGGIQRIRSTTDPRQVPRLLSEQQPDLVLLDLHMPHVDGHQVLLQIGQYAAGDYLPVLVLTADTTTTARNRALAAGARDFLTKPLDTDEATLRIANLLETRQLYAALRPHRPVVVDDGTQRRRIESVLAREAITPVFQPVIDLTTLDAVGYEGLSQFSDPPQRAPHTWFLDAFDVGLGVDLEWLAAGLQLPALDWLPPGAFLALNLSPAAILHIGEQQLVAPELCPRIVIEITEHVPVEDYAAVHRALAPMRDEGARLAADDLGSGYAGLRHLISLQPDIIKLDISLVAGLHRSTPQRALCRAMVSFAVEIGAMVIAEGVESEEELDALRGIGAHWAQGYHFGRPAEAPVAL